MQHRAFSLMELMLVVVIVGAVYGVTLSGMKRYGEASMDLQLEDLAAFLSVGFPGEDVSLVCTDACQKCAVYIGAEAVQEVESFLDATVETYRFDHRYGTQKVSWPPIFDEDGRDETVCFRYDRYRDGTASELLVAYQGRVVHYPSYFGEPQLYASLQEAETVHESMTRKVYE